MEPVTRTACISQERSDFSQMDRRSHMGNRCPTCKGAEATAKAKRARRFRNILERPPDMKS